jgi:hypothetical protein
MLPRQQQHCLPAPLLRSSRGGAIAIHLTPAPLVGGLIKVGEAQLGEGAVSINLAALIRWLKPEGVTKVLEPLVVKALRK